MKLARRPIASLLAPPVVAVILRIALLPVFPVPYPVIRDEFAYLLAADTYASGRLTNPTNPNYEHFESRHVLQKPTYMAKYPPGQGIVLALGQLLGHPWIGVLLSSIAMCALLGWASRLYLSAPWNLALVTLASLRYILVSYWANSYWGGAVAAIGGCLVIGSLARLDSAPGRRQGALLGLGLGVLACSRPSEGLAFGVVACAIWAVRSLAENSWRLTIQRFASSVASAAVCVGVILAIFAFDNKAVTGDPLVMPYQAFNEQYEMAPLFVWQHPRSVALGNDRLKLAAKADLETAAESRAEPEFRWQRIGSGILYFFWPPLLLIPVLFCLPGLLRSAPTRNLIILIALSLVWSSFGTFFFAHYVAALLAPFWICGVQALRMLRVSIRRRSRAWGYPGHTPRFATLIVGSHLCLLTTAGIGAGLDLTGRQWVLPPRGFGWCCPETATGRKDVEAQLESVEGRHLVFVRYPSNELPYLEWVYNRADINAGRVIWAHSLDPQKDAHLRAQYPDRRAWTADLTAYPKVSLTPLP